MQDVAARKDGKGICPMADFAKIDFFAERVT
jgi:hypothetical protein